MVVGLELVVLACVTALSWAGIAFTTVPMERLVGLCLIISFAMVQGLVLSEYPRGNDHAFLRLGLATFCRTGLSLMAVIAIAKYSGAASKKEAIFFVAVLYAVGHFGSMILSARHTGSDATD